MVPINGTVRRVGMKTLKTNSTSVNQEGQGA